MAELTPKQARFIEEYLVDLCGTKAAIRSGYAERSAKKIAHELLQKPVIQEAVAAANAERSERTAITADQVLRDIARLAQKAETAGEFHAALKGRELLGKHLKLFTEKHEHGGLGGGPVQLLVTREDESL